MIELKTISGYKNAYCKLSQIEYVKLLIEKYFLIIDDVTLRNDNDEEFYISFEQRLLFYLQVNADSIYVQKYHAHDEIYDYINKMTSKINFKLNKRQDLCYHFLNKEENKKLKPQAERFFKNLKNKSNRKNVDAESKYKNY